MFKRFETLVDPYPADDSGTPPTGLWAFIWHYTRPMAPWLAIMSVLTATISIIELVFFSFTGALVNWLAASDRATFLVDHAWELGGMAAVVLIGFPVVTLVQALLMFQTVFGSYPMIVRWRAHRQMLRQSLSFFQDEFAGRVSQKVMQTSLAVRETVLKLMDVGVYVVTMLVGTAYLFVASDPWMLVALLVWLAAYVGLLVWFVPRLGKVGEEQADARAEMTGRVVDSYTNIQTVKLFAHSNREQDYARGAMDEFLGTVHRQMRLITGLTWLLNVLNSLLLVAVGAIAVFAWQNGAITIGAVTVALGLVLRMRGISQWIMWETAGLFENIGTVQDGIGMLTKPIAIVDKDAAKELTVDAGAIRFDHARFHYGRATKVIEDFSLDIAPGEKVGLVGRSGAGKSTLVNLLLRFYDLEGGRIVIDGQDIASVTQESLRREIGMVTQDTSLLHRSVMDNILYGRPDASEEEARAAARLAHAEGFIADLTDPKGRSGYAAHVGERGVKLSGGQRQRIAIARVFLKNAPILVLDEATSALDSEIEAAIQESLGELMAGKTVIAIAHRLSTIAAMDRLVVLDRGRIVEQGTHAELLRKDGLYAALWSRQSGGFLLLDADAEAAE